MKIQNALILGLLSIIALGVWTWESNGNEPAFLSDWHSLYGPQAQFSGPVPVTLPDGRQAYLMVPQEAPAQNYVHPVYSPQPTLQMVPAQRPLTRVVEQPVERIVERRVVTEEQIEDEEKRSWEREVLIVAGSAGAGAAIGGVAGGKKGAAVGAISGGVAGLVYDLATRNKKK